MKRIGIVTTLSLLALVPLTICPVQAQDQDPDVAPARNTRQRPLETVLREWNRSTGTLIVAESSLAGAQAPLSRERVTTETLEAQLDELVKSLPKGTTWVKVMLPASRAYKGDDVADYVMAQSRLFGRVGSAEEGKVEVLGQKLGANQAAPIVSTLNLKPVYLLVNATARLNRGTAAFNSLSPDQQAEMLNQGFQNFLNMPPEQRQQIMQGFMRQMGAMMQNLPPEQRRNFFQNLFGPGGPPGPPGGGGGGTR